MRHPHNFTLSSGWRLLLEDLGIDPADIVRRAGLPKDLLARDSVSLSTTKYFALWQAIDEEADDPKLPIRIAEALSAEVFDAPIFAALCSPDLNVAARRISRFKRLIGPLALHVFEGPQETKLELEWLDKAMDPPPLLTDVELVFFVQLVRLGTRQKICPVSITAPHVPEPIDAFTEYFGKTVELAPALTVTFSAADATRPFLTVNQQMWEVFEPHLQARLSELDDSASMRDRVRNVLLELLPSGRSSIDAVASELAVSRRTLQRHLHREQVTFQLVLDQVREELTKHYLKNTALPTAQIAFLVGYDDPNSLFRAFHSWTGSTPEAVRSGATG